MCNNPIETWALYNINKAYVIWMKSWPIDQFLAQHVRRESLSGDIYSGSPADFCLALKYPALFSFFFFKWWCENSSKLAACQILT